MREQSLAILMTSLVDRSLRDMLRVNIVAVRTTQPSTFAETADIAVRVPFRAEGDEGCFVLFGPRSFFEVTLLCDAGEPAVELTSTIVDEWAKALATNLAERLGNELANYGVHFVHETPDIDDAPVRVASGLRPLAHDGAMTLLYACHGDVFACLVDVRGDTTLTTLPPSSDEWSDDEDPTSVNCPVLWSEPEPASTHAWSDATDPCFTFSS